MNNIRSDNKMFILKKIKYKFFQEWFPNWSPDGALRYLPIVKAIKKDPTLKTIIDVGSGSLGITPYLKQPVVGVDLAFVGPKSPLLKQVTGTIGNLPFADNSFDAVVCVDVLEHLHSRDRRSAVIELLRVAKKKVFLMVPCGSKSEAEDRFFTKHIKKVMGRPDVYLQQHLKFGLPEAKDITSWINSNWQVCVDGNVSLPLHRLILLAQFSKNKLVQFISSVIFILLIPLFSMINFEPSYRKLFIIEKI